MSDKARQAPDGDHCAVLWSSFEATSDILASAYLEYTNKMELVMLVAPCLM